MHNAPTTPTPSVSTAAAVCLAVSAVAAAGLACVIYVDMYTHLEPSRGFTGLLAAICSISGFGYISRSAEDRIGRREADAAALILDRIDQVEQRMDEHAAKFETQCEDRVASAFVNKVATGGHLSVVSQR